jgi:hypothetical protein
MLMFQKLKNKFFIKNFRNEMGIKDNMTLAGMIRRG